MSYRMYIASHSKQSDIEKSNKFKNVIIPNMQQSAEFKDSFLNHEFLKRFGCEVQIELGTESIASEILAQCPSYIPETVIADYCEYLPENSDDEAYIGLLTKELLWKYIQRIHEEHIKCLIRMYDECKKDSKFAESYTIRRLADERCVWETSLKTFDSNQIPYCVSKNPTFLIYELYDLYRKNDFQTNDLIIYGW